MSKQKIETGAVRPVARRGDTEPQAMYPVRKQRLQVLSLELEEDAGGDPYNRTGQFCVIEGNDEQQ